MALLKHLPAESATMTAIRDNMTDEEISANSSDKYGSWSHTEMLLAFIIDKLGEVSYILSAANGGKPKKPVPYPRPGVKKKRLNEKQMAFLMEKRRAYQEEREALERRM